MVVSKQKSPLGRFYTFVTVLCPLLMMYNFGIATVTILDAAIVFFLFFAVLSGKVKLTKLEALLFLYICLMIINFVFSSIYRDTNIIGILLRMVRLIVYLLWGIVGGRRYFDGELAVEIWKFICIFATGYLMLQYVFLALFNISIPGYLPFLDLSREELATFTKNLYFSKHARPRSIFAEPSQYGIYLTGFFSVALLKKNYTLSKLTILFLFVGMVLSASTVAFLGIFLTVLLILFDRVRRKKGASPHELLCIAGLVMVAVCVCILKWDSVYALFEKIFLRLPSSFNNRVSGWAVITEALKSEGILTQLFGTGMDADYINSLDWTSSLMKILFYFGYVGAVVFVCTVLLFMTQNKKNINYYIAILLLFGFFTELLVSNWLVLFLPFVHAIEPDNTENKRCLNAHSPN